MGVQTIISSISQQHYRDPPIDADSVQAKYFPTGPDFHLEDSVPRRAWLLPQGAQRLTPFHGAKRQPS